MSTRAAAVLLALAVLTGCTDDGRATSPPTTAGSPATVTTPPTPDGSTPTTPEGWRRVEVVDGLSFAVPEAFTAVPGATANPAGVALDAGTNEFLHAVSVDQAVAGEGDGAAPVATLDAYRAALFAGRAPDDLAWEEATYRGLPAARFGELSPSGDVALEGFAVTAPGGIVVLSRHLYLYDEADPHAEVPFETYLAAFDLDPGAIPASFWLGA